MLIILPPSETKLRPPEVGSPLELDQLSFPSLTGMRKRVMDAMVATSVEPDALRRLFVGPSLAGEVARNVHVRDLPTRTAVETYAGPLYHGLDAGSWSPLAEERAARHVVIASALWGALRVADHIPAYRLHVCSRLVGMDRLEPAWRPHLSPILTDAADGGPIVDLRSPAYQAVGRPAGLDDQTVTLRIRPAAGQGRIGDVVAKRVRGQAASCLLASKAEPEDVLDIADILATRWSIEVDQPVERNQSWTITLHASADDAHDQMAHSRTSSARSHQ